MGDFEFPEEERKGERVTPEDAESMLTEMRLMEKKGLLMVCMVGKKGIIGNKRLFNEFRIAIGMTKRVYDNKDASGWEVKTNEEI